MGSSQSSQRRRQSCRRRGGRSLVCAYDALPDLVPLPQPELVLGTDGVPQLPSPVRNLAAMVDFALFYARTLYERELHDELLNKALEADPVQDGMTLFNVLAQQDARRLLDTADDHF